MTPAERAQIDELTERVRQLENMVHYKEPPLYRGISLTRANRVVLAVLVKSDGVVTKERLTQILNLPEIQARTQVLRLRRRLSEAPALIRIVTEHNSGYYMPDEDKTRLAKLAVIQAKQDTP